MSNVLIKTILTLIWDRNMGKQIYEEFLTGHSRFSVHLILLHSGYEGEGVSFSEFRVLVEELKRHHG